MIERSEDLCFSFEPGRPVGIGAKVSGKTLSATSRFSDVIVRSIHLAHAAQADLSAYFIRPEA